ncbi:MAG: hypothetical protein ABEJ31_08720 [Haloarculaceae archaeon]
MTEGYDPDDVPVHRDDAARDAAYERAQAAGEPYFAIERVDGGYAITYDLLPAGAQLTRPVVADLRERVTASVEDVVGDPDRPTGEVGHSIGDSLGNLSTFATEETAREVAATLSRIVLERDNWTDASDGVGGTGADPHRND